MCVWVCMCVAVLSVVEGWRVVRALSSSDWPGMERDLG